MSEAEYQGPKIEDEISNQELLKMKEREVLIAELNIRAARLQSEICSYFGYNEQSNAINMLVNYCIAQLIGQPGQDEKFRQSVMIGNLKRITEGILQLKPNLRYARVFLDGITEKQLSPEDEGNEPSSGQTMETSVLQNALRISKLPINIEFIGGDGNFYYAATA